MRQATAVKLFVGQIPKAWTEADVRTEFETFGDIFRMYLVKDKDKPGHHKGCAFVTFYDPEAAQNAIDTLHDKKTLPGMKQRIQVKAAEAEKNAETRKLFVGMLSKSLDEKGLMDMFSPYGPLEDFTILKDQNGSKGCAFVTYQTRLQAQNAIKQLNGSTTMEGARGPLVVKLADNGKEKQLKSTVEHGLVMGGGVGMVAGGSGISTASGSIANMNIPVGQQPMTTDVAILAAQVAYYQQMFAQMGMPHVIANAPGASHTIGQIVMGGTGTASVVPSAIGQNINSGLINAPNVHQQQPQPYLTTIVNPPQVITNDQNRIVQGVIATNQNPPLIQGVGTANQNALVQGVLTSNQNPLGQGVVTTTNLNQVVQSSDDANLFIYHLPTNFSDSELIETFSPFGGIISAKVYVDKQTGVNKGFGFVCYDNPISASNAIAAMNGFVLGSKKLKVQLKRRREQAKPY